MLTLAKLFFWSNNLQIWVPMLLPHVRPLVCLFVFFVHSRHILLDDAHTLTFSKLFCFTPLFLSRLLETCQKRGSQYTFFPINRPGEMKRDKNCFRIFPLDFIRYWRALLGYCDAISIISSGTSTLAWSKMKNRFLWLEHFSLADCSHVWLTYLLLLFYIVKQWQKTRGANEFI